jgi:transposase-like protein
VDETYARIRGRWHYIYRAIDGHGQIVDAYVLPARDTVAACRFFELAVASSGTTPRRVITDKAATYPPALAAAVPGVLHVASLALWLFAHLREGMRASGKGSGSSSYSPWCVGGDSGRFS